MKHKKRLSVWRLHKSSHNFVFLFQIHALHQTAFVCTLKLLGNNFPKGDFTKHLNIPNLKLFCLEMVSCTTTCISAETVSHKLTPQVNLTNTEFQCLQLTLSIAAHLLLLVHQCEVLCKDLQEK